jgi:hypothetical protein
MSNEIGGLRAFLSANAARFEQDMNQAKEAVRKSAKGMSAAMEGVRKAFEGTMKFIEKLAPAVMANATAIAYMIKKQIDAADAAAKEAQAVGTTVETLTAMQYVAGLAGVSQEALSKAFVMTARNAAEAAKGTGTAKDAYDALGISVVDANGNLKNSEQLWMEVADRFKGMEDGAGKTALAVALFGKSGAELIPMLNQGATGMRGMMEEAKQLGAVLDTETAQAAERFKDNIERLQAVKTGWINQIIKSVLPTLEAFTDRMIKSAKSTDTMATAGAQANAALKLLLTTGVVLKTVFDAVGTTIGAQAAALNQIAHGNFKGGFDIYKNLFTEDLPAKAKKAGDDIAAIWNDTAGKIQKDAPENAKKIAAPMMGAADETKKAADKLKKEWEKAQEDINRQIEALQFQAATYGKTTAEIALYRLELAGANAEQMASARLALDDIAAKEVQANAFKDAEDKLTRLGNSAKSFYDSTRTPAERYNETLKELNELLNVGAIDMDLFSRASQQAWEDMEKAVEKTKDKDKTFTDDLKDAFSGWANNMSSTLNDVLWDSNSTFEDIATSFGKMISQMIIQTQIIKPLMKELFGGEGESGGGWFGSLFGGGGGGESSLGGMGGGGGILGSVVGLIGGLFHKGGVMSQGKIYPMARGAIVTGPSIFPMAQGYGLMGEDGPEAVMPLIRTSSGELGVKTEGGGGNKQITLNMHIVTPNADSFRKAQGQIMAEATMALQRGQRNL